MVLVPAGWRDLPLGGPPGFGNTLFGCGLPLRGAGNLARSRLSGGSFAPMRKLSHR